MVIAVRAGGHVAQMEAIFNAHLETPEAKDGLV